MRSGRAGSSWRVGPRAGIQIGRSVSGSRRLGMVSARPPGLSSGWPSILLLLPLVLLVALIAALVMPHGNTPTAPTVSGTPKPGISPSSPTLGHPHPEAPTLPGVNPSAPNVDFGSGGGGNDGSQSQGAPEGPEHRTEWVHVHHRLWNWWLDLPLLLLSLIGLAIARSFARLPRPGQHGFGALVASGLVGLAIGAFAIGIKQEPGPGTYHRNPLKSCAPTAISGSGRKRLLGAFPSITTTSRSTWPLTGSSRASGWQPLPFPALASQWRGGRSPSPRNRGAQPHDYERNAKRYGQGRRPTTVADTRGGATMILSAILQRWLLFGWVGRLASLAAALYAFGWVFGNLGMDSFARQFGSAAIFVLSVLLTALVIRWFWRAHTGPRP